MLEDSLDVKTHLLEDGLEIEGAPECVQRVEAIVADYESLLHQGHRFTNGDGQVAVLEAAFTIQ